MLRYRRYRVFVVFAVIAVFALYKFSSSGASWQDLSTGSAQNKEQDQLGAIDRPATASLDRKPRPQVAQETKKPDLEIAAASKTTPLKKLPAITPIDRPVDKPPPHAPTKPAGPKPTSPANGKPVQYADGEQLAEAGMGRVEVAPLASSLPAVHWSKASEHFPVPTKDIIKLPSGKAKKIPKIQHTFKQETAAEKKDRQNKLNIIKGVAKRSWDGYREHAWLQDEVKPLSGGYKNPFAGWGATLVDSLDTLWIMGMKQEFEEAVNATREIDFTTSPRADIPLFETTIRYLGGFLAAYDISDRKYEILLAKAVELAEILMAAFDTPNRMPITYYYWRPAFSSQTHRASNRVVLAEIGSLSVEFTRLAQLTDEPKYYDAIARITDKLEAFQKNTRLPGMWPTYIDASGCKRPEYAPQSRPDPQVPLAGLSEVPEPAESPSTTTGKKLSPNGKEYKPLDLPSPVVFVADTSVASPQAATALVEGVAGKARIGAWDENTKIGDLTKDSGSHRKRQADRFLEPVASDSTSTSSSAAALATPKEPECEDQEFVTSNPSHVEEYTLGGMSDSTYEYLPKQWLLLGGQVDKYRTMYEASMDVVKEKLLFRPMLPDGNDILFSGKLNVYPGAPGQASGQLQAENAHLTCFAGGMFAMGAKIYDRPEDLEIAKKLTEGCVWSYDMTSSGIMPEAFNVVACKSKEHCDWNQTLYEEVIDPFSAARITSYKQQMEIYKDNLASASAQYEIDMASATAAPLSTALDTLEAEATPTPIALLGSLEQVNAAVKSKDSRTEKKKRQLDIDTEAEPSSGTALTPPKKAPGDNSQGHVEPGLKDETPTPVKSVSQVSSKPSPTLPSFPVIYSPRPPLTHEQFVKNRIQEERLPKGVVSIGASNYILRPEAIESVFYLYRITGSPHWREAGWRMFEAINSHTATMHGNSAIDDVTKTAPELKDEMESFWIAETLKYFYLLFEDESVVSLDEWVLNTEAHGFRRPR